MKCLPSQWPFEGMKLEVTREFTRKRNRDKLILPTLFEMGCEKARDRTGGRPNLPT